MTGQTRIGLFGGVYSNALALRALLQDAGMRGLDRLYCLGDLGAFGPYPDRVCEVLRATGIPVIQGNYDHSLGNGLADCRCGYTDPRDNYFAKLSYDYTFSRTSTGHKCWLAQLPAELRLTIGPWRVLLCHGSPRKTNEFLWETATSDAFLAWLFKRYECDVIVATHTGLPWAREVTVQAGCQAHAAQADGVPRSGWFVNCGAIGRPANDGRTTVIYAVLSLPHTMLRKPEVKFVRLAYDHERFAGEMRAEGLPEEFVQTILTGWWTTCNEILPAKERARGRY
ncbi:MAG: metallophosphoesterase family protein [Verrucomicrobia bacterium]|nr:metallophosphoesterase family protein [Verrucomicrobiota bacterium]